MSKILSTGFPADEVETAKRAFLQEQQVQRAGDEYLVRRLAQQARWGWTMARDADLERKISALTPEQVSSAVKRHVDLSSLTIIKAGDFKKAEAAQ